MASGTSCAPFEAWFMMSSKSMRSWGAIAFVVSLGACAGSGPTSKPPVLHGTGLIGHVVDEQGRPLGGVPVRVHFTHGIPFQAPTSTARPEVLTGSDGNFRIMGLGEGDVQVEAIQRDDRKALGEPVHVAPQVEVDAGTLRIEPTGQIIGQISGESGITLLGTSVFVPGLPYAVRTDEQGRFVLTHLPRGRHRLVADHVRLGQVDLGPIEVMAGKSTDGIHGELPGGSPRLDTFAPGWVGPGGWVDIQGSHLAMDPFIPTVYVGGMRMSEVEVRSPEHLRARVTHGAPSGRITVQVGEMSGSSSESLRVISALRWDPPEPWLIRSGDAFKPHVMARAQNEEILLDGWVDGRWFWARLPRVLGVAVWVWVAGWLAG